MIALPLGAPDRPLRVLALGAHADDIELGCGATMLRLVEERPDTELCWAVASADGTRADEARASAAAFTAGLTTPPTVVVGTFRDGYLPYSGGDVKAWVHGLGDLVTPDVVFTHAPGDLHQDHRLLAELALNAFRDQPLLGFEIPKYDGDLGRPNVFVHADEARARAKMALAATHFASQTGKPWFDEATFLGLMRLRGVESRSPSGYAEAFHTSKLVVSI
ncbi:MAG: PIG-L deacetylase family protein [Acidimicrobiia bacterium]